MRYANSISNYSRYIGNENTRLVDATSQSSAHGERIPREFSRRNRDRRETSRPWPWNAVVKSIFAIFEIPGINVMSSLSAKSLPFSLRLFQL